MAIQRSVLALGSFVVLAHCAMGCGSPPPPTVATVAPPPPPPVQGCGTSPNPCAEGERCLFGSCTAFHGDVSVGRVHVCRASSRGDVSCWGDNSSNQLGVSNVPYRLEPTPVDGVSDVVQVASGDDYTCALTASGEVFCWGASIIDEVASATEPGKGVERLTGISDVIRISAGAKHACALSSTGQVWCWGNNANLKVGAPDSNKNYPPTPVEGIADAVDVVAADEHTCAVLKSGQIKCWGTNDGGQLGDGSTDTREGPVEVKGIDDAVRVSAYVGLTCAAHRSGEVSCWGKSFWGGLGDGESRETTQPVGVKDINDAVAVSAGAEFACAVLRSGKVKCWGPHDEGQLGYGTPEFGFGKNTPVEVVGLDDAVRLSAGENTTCAIRANGETTCWGSNRNGMLGNGSARDVLVPSPVEGIEPATRVVAGHDFTCALGQSGRVWCWGFGAGDCSVTNQQRPRATPPQAVEGLSDVRDLFATDRNVCAVRADNQVLCWFGGLLRYLSDDPNDNRSWRPSAAAVPPLKSLSGEERWFWGTDAAGNVFTWAMREGWEDGKPTTTTIQRKATGLPKASSVVANTYYACVLGTNKTVQCWKPEREELDSKSKREGTVRVRSEPIPGIKTAVQLAIDGARACALLEDGTVGCWEGNRTADPKTKKMPKIAVEPLAGVSEATQLVGPGLQPKLGCAVLRSGQLTCWGPNGPKAPSGFPGIASRGWGGSKSWVLRGAGVTVGSETSPVENMMDVLQVALGNDHICALRKNGQVACWGDNGADAVGSLGISRSFAPLVVRTP